MPAVLDRALAERTALMLAPVLQRAQPAAASGQRDCAAVHSDTADPALGRHVHRVDPVPAIGVHAPSTSHAAAGMGSTVQSPR